MTRRKVAPQDVPEMLEIAKRGGELGKQLAELVIGEPDRTVRMIALCEALGFILALETLEQPQLLPRAVEIAERALVEAAERNAKRLEQAVALMEAAVEQRH